ncbi:MAG: hypothetical protein ACYDCL_16145 [Myxococcales bacterium]
MGGFCETDAGSFIPCSGGGCPAGTICLYEILCAQTACATAADGNLCGYPDGGGGGTCCGSSCVDIGSDVQNCGGCGIACTAGALCLQQQCVPPSCAGLAPTSACLLPDGGLGACCSGSCVGSNDPANCGRCDEVCPVGSACSDGSCVANGQPVQCVLGAVCPDGTGCTDDGCFPLECQADQQDQPCAYADEAAPGANSAPLETGGVGTCCGGQCVSTLADPRNCGGCGNVVDAGFCLYGLPFPPAPLDGGCAACAFNEACVDGVCAVYACSNASPYCLESDGGLGLCCPDGSCRDLLNDPITCGDCGSSCPAGQTCSGGICSGTQTPCGQSSFYAFCDPDAGAAFLCCPGEGCSDLQTDSANCGYCGRSCSTGSQCTAGLCQ